VKLLHKQVLSYIGGCVSSWPVLAKLNFIKMCAPWQEDEAIVRLCDDNDLSRIANIVRLRSRTFRVWYVCIDVENAWAGYVSAYSLHVNVASTAKGVKVVKAVTQGSRLTDTASGLCVSLHCLSYQYKSHCPSLPPPILQAAQPTSPMGASTGSFGGYFSGCTSNDG
jgi:hypothetical protein